MASNVKTGLVLEGDSKGATKAIDATTDSVEELDKTTKKASKNVRKNTKDTETSFQKLGKSAARMGAAVGVAAVALGAMVTRKVIENTKVQDAAVAQLNATLESTGFAAGKTSDDLQQTAAALQQVTAFGDETIITGQAILATFKEIKGDQFDRATVAVLDMATALKTDLKSAAIQIGKALNDPSGQLTALSRAGINFTDTQKDMIKAMTEAGDVAGAQAMILAELESEFGGSAEAYRNTLGGALEGLSNAYNDLFEAETEASASLIESINAIEGTLSNAQFQENIQALVTGLLDITNNAVQAVAKLAEVGDELERVWARTVGVGIATDDREGLEARIETLNKQLEFLAKQGQTAGGTVNGIKKELAELEAKLAVNISLFGDDTTETKKNTDAKKDNAKAAGDQADAQGGANDAIGESVKVTGAATKKTDGLAKSKQKLAKLLADENKQTIKNNQAFDEYITNAAEEIRLSKESERTQYIENEVRRFGTDITEKQAEQIRIMAGHRYDEIDAVEKTALAYAGAAHTIGSAIDDMVGDSNGAFATLFDGFGEVLTELEKAGKGIQDVFDTQAIKDFGFALLQVSAQYAASELFERETSGAGAAIGAVVGAYYGEQGGAAAGAFIGEGLESTLFGQDNDGSNRGKATFDLSTGRVDASGVGKTFSDKNVQSALNLVNALVEFTSSIGPSNLSGRVFVGGDDGIRYGGQSFGTDAEAFLQTAYRDAVAGATELDAGLKELITTFINASDSAQDMAAFAGAIISLNDNASIDAVANSIQDFADASRSLSQIYYDQAAAVSEQITAFDGSLQSVTTLNQGLVDAQAAAYDFAQSILAVGQSLADQAERSAESIRESILTEEELLQKREQERTALQKSLATLTDPAEIEEATRRILQLNEQIFGSLSEDEQNRRAEEFALVAENTNDLAQKLLDRALTDLQKTSEDINRRVAEMLGTAASQQQAAADTQQSAANTFSNAVASFANTNITVIVPESEVNA
jgi:hypothetical protein